MLIELPQIKRPVQNKSLSLFGQNICTIQHKYVMLHAHQTDSFYNNVYKIVSQYDLNKGSLTL